MRVTHPAFMLAASMLALAILPQALLAGESGSAAAQSAYKKPRVGVNLPLVSEKISSYTKNYLDLEKLVAEIEKAVGATRKFDVVSRQVQTMHAIRQEQKLSKSKYFAGDGAQEGQLHSADFLVVTKVLDMSYYRKSTPIPNIDDKYKVYDAGSIQLGVQIVDTQTGQTKANFNVSDSFKSKTEVKNTAGGGVPSGYFTSMARKTAGELADKFIDTVFPMVVIAVKGDTVWINRGQDGGLKEGQSLVVFSKGEELRDPYTGELLGSAEEKIGKVKVFRIDPKLTKAKMSSSSMTSMIKTGDIVRRP